MLCRRLIANVPSWFKRAPRWASTNIGRLLVFSSRIKDSYPVSLESPMMCTDDILSRSYYSKGTYEQGEKSQSPTFNLTSMSPADLDLVTIQFLVRLGV